MARADQERTAYRINLGDVLIALCMPILCQGWWSEQSQTVVLDYSCCHELAESVRIERIAIPDMYIVGTLKERPKEDGPVEFLTTRVVLDVTAELDEYDIQRRVLVHRHFLARGVR